MNKNEDSQNDIVIPTAGESRGKKHKSDSRMLTESKNITHDGIQGYKKKLFIALRHKTLLQIFIHSIYLIKILFSLCFAVLLLSYISPDLVKFIFKGFERSELQDFLLKVIAGGFFNQLFANIFGSKNEK
jgi:hypothetical protein